MNKLDVYIYNLETYLKITKVIKHVTNFLRNEEKRMCKYYRTY
jgi:hypothetical protein